MEQERLREHVDTIRETFSYIKQFRGKTFVVKIDCVVMNDPLFSVLVKDLALLHEAGIRIVIAPSAKERIDEILGTYKVPYTIIKGVRVTSEQAIPFIKMAAFDVSNRVMTMLSANGITAVIGNWVRARGIGVIDGIDFQSAGVVESVRVESVRSMLDEGVVPIFPCIGWSSVGTPYNISSNELAVVVATTLGAEKLIFVTAREGFAAGSFVVPETVPVAPGGRLANFSLADLDAFFAANPGRDADLELLHRAQRACTGGVERVHLLDGREEGVILKETFSNLGSGTMVYSNRYGGIRPMTLNDISDVLRIMRPFVERGILLPRTEAQLEETLQDFIVFEVDDSVHACAALHEFPERLGEIAGIAVDEHFLHLGVGPKLVDFLCERARRRNLSAVFVLTTQTADWFLKLGFAEADPAALPEKKRLSYSLQRKSRVFVKNLGSA
ncbi:MAG: amino-acid N-acetyltransferase [Spirochaetia bacterium]|jgi:amino-acid N-acetyltransferase